MMLTTQNLNEVLFENEDAKLLISDVLAHTQANLYYYHDLEITVAHALNIWNSAMAADETQSVYTVSFFDMYFLKDPGVESTIQYIS